MWTSPHTHIQATFLGLGIGLCQCQRTVKGTQNPERVCVGICFSAVWKPGNIHKILNKPLFTVTASESVNAPLLCRWKFPITTHKGDRLYYKARLFTKCKYSIHHRINLKLIPLNRLIVTEELSSTASSSGQYSLDRESNWYYHKTISISYTVTGSHRNPVVKGQIPWTDLIDI